jgi:hypothetical protein
MNFKRIMNLFDLFFFFGGVVMDILNLWSTGTVYSQIGFDEESRIYNDFADGIIDLIRDGIEPVRWIYPM